jgi:hypothetical protein
MAQAGWYSAPGEPGMLRYFNGERWTDHRQPAPEAESAPLAVSPTVPTEARTPVASLPELRPSSPSVMTFAISMDEYEKQFEQLERAQFSLEPATSFAPLGAEAEPEAPQEPTFDAEWLTTAPSSTELELFIGGLHDEQPRVEAADNQARSVPRRRGFRGVVTGMILSVVFIALGIGLILFTSQQVIVGVGEAPATGVVTDLGVIGGSSGSTCAPVATFAAGGSFVTRAAAAVSPCPLSLGQSVNVVYSKADPGTTGRIQIPDSVLIWLWAIPIVGILTFGMFLIMTLVRAKGSQLAAPAART